jgi:acid phosphatase type 7
MAATADSKREGLLHDDADDNDKNDEIEQKEALPPWHQKLHRWLLDGSITERHRRLVRLVLAAITSSLAALLFAIAVIVAAIGYAFVTSPNRQAYHGVYVPTLLRVHDGLYYLSALENPLYRALQNGTYVHNRTVLPSSAQVTLRATPSTITPWSNLTLTWECADGAAGRNAVADTDVVILLCGDNATALSEGGGGVTDPALILEAATVKQARSTSVQNGGGSPSYYVNKNAWYITDFPVLRYEYCVFHMYRKQATTYYHFATSDLVTLRNFKRTPGGIHLAYTSDPSSMTAHFQTGSIHNTQPVARYYVSNSGANDDAVDAADATTYVYGGTTTSYQASDMCRAPANQLGPGKYSHPGSLHSIVLDNLQAGYQYTYQVGLQSLENDDGEEIVWSDPYEFTAAMEAGDTTPFSYLVYGDQGCPSGGCRQQGRDWMEAVLKLRPAQQYPISQLHHVGDLAYALGASHQWDTWLDMVQVAAAKVPLQIAVGNHEYCYTTTGGGVGQDGAVFQDSSGVDRPFQPAWGNFGDDSQGECGVPVASRFAMPANGNGIFWYSHEYGMLHTTVLSSEHNLTIGSPQYEWLAADLAGSDRSVTPWLAVEVHRPLYEAEAYWGDRAVGEAMRTEIEDLLYQYRVDLVLAGHYHAYSRTCDGLYQSRCNVPGAPLHITVGTAGGALDTAGLYRNDWTERFIRTEFGHGRITVHNESAMQFELVRVGRINDASNSGGGLVLDEVWLMRDRQG